jgi:hypothetical protein
MLSATSRDADPRPAQAGSEFAGAIVGGEYVLLPVAFQHLVARGRYLGAILLKAGQNGEVALIDHCATVALDIAVTSLLLVRCSAAGLLLGNRAG